MRRWFITGVSSGLGRALAQAALEVGDVVAGTVRSEPARRDFAALHADRAFGYVMDVTDHAAVAAAVHAAQAETGALDIVVNNAGYSLEGTLEETGWADIEAQFAANLFGPIAVIKAVLPAMRARHSGLIVNVTSLAGLLSSPGVGIYGGAKLALESVSDALAQEVEPFGIGVMVVVPGAFRTDLGLNRRSAADTIADYAEQNSRRRQRLAALSGHQRGDPAKAAQAVLAAIGTVPRPRRFLVGGDAVEHVRGFLSRYDAEIERWQAVSSETDLADQ